MSSTPGCAPSPRCIPLRPGWKSGECFSQPCRASAPFHPVEIARVDHEVAIERLKWRQRHVWVVLLVLLHHEHPRRNFIFCWLLANAFLANLIHKMIDPVQLQRLVGEFIPVAALLCGIHFCLELIQRNTHFLSDGLRQTSLPLLHGLQFLLHVGHVAYGAAGHLMVQNNRVGIRVTVRRQRGDSCRHACGETSHNNMHGRVAGFNRLQDSVALHHAAAWRIVDHHKDGLGAILIVEIINAVAHIVGGASDDRSVQFNLAITNGEHAVLEWLHGVGGRRVHGIAPLVLGFAVGDLRGGGLRQGGGAHLLVGNF